jgi:hypothetical protein
MGWPCNGSKAAPNQLVAKRIARFAWQVVESAPRRKPAHLLRLCEFLLRAEKTTLRQIIAGECLNQRGSIHGTHFSTSHNIGERRPTGQKVARPPMIVPGMDILSSRGWILLPTHPHIRPRDDNGPRCCGCKGNSAPGG